MTKNNLDLCIAVEGMYKNYSIEDNARVIPHIIDGLKKTQRKIVYVSRYDARKLIKVSALSGAVTKDTDYHHGEASSQAAISLMAQDFTGSNNYPLFDTKGSFGNMFGEKPAQARYIFVKNSKYMDLFFNKDDDSVLLPNSDIGTPEPEYYVPIIPYVLTNGIQGIGVGYYCGIPSYNLSEIIDNIECVLDKKEKTHHNLKPYYKDFIGNIVKNDDSWYMYGKFERVNATTLKIIEMPIGSNADVYKEEVLNVLVDKGIIKDYDDLSDSKWNIIIKASKEFVAKSDKELIDIFYLKKTIKEILTVIWKNDIITFDNPNEIIDIFVEERLKFYEKRKNKKLNDLRTNIYKNIIKLEVNKYILSKDNIKQFNKEEIVGYFNDIKHEIYFASNDKDVVCNNIEELVETVLSNLQFLDILSDKRDKIWSVINSDIQSYSVLEATSATKIYKKELKDLRKQI